MRETVNPLLLQVLHRRRMLRGVRWSATAWVIFGGLHIAVWWFAFEHTPDGWPRGLLGAAVWPLLLIATASFITLVVYGTRWLLSPIEPPADDWLERAVAADPGIDRDAADEGEPTIVGLRA
jgi:hypothetical protein